MPGLVPGIAVLARLVAAFSANDPAR